MAIAIMHGHDVTVVLHGPGWRATGFSRDHDYSRSGGHVAHSTRYVMIMCTLERVFIFSTIYTSIVLHSTSVCEGSAVLWVRWHAEMISSTTMVAVKGAPHYTRIE